MTGSSEKVTGAGRLDERRFGNGMLYLHYGTTHR
jgi:hypothetical protein